MEGWKMQFVYFINLDCSNCSAEDEDCICEYNEFTWKNGLVLGLVGLSVIIFLVRTLYT